MGCVMQSSIFKREESVCEVFAAAVAVAAKLVGLQC